MDFNFPLILVILVAVTGGIALVDILFFRKSRNQDIAAVKNRFKGINLEKEKDKKAYNAAILAASAEPWPVEYAKSFFPVLAFVLVLRSFVVEPFQIPSESMVPTLEVGDFILVNKFAYGLRLPVIRTKIIPIGQPKRGDVMVFFPPHDKRYFIKRVIGLPGDKIEFRNNQLWINGEEAPQELVEKEQRIRGLDNCNGYFQILNETIGEKEHAMRKCAIPGYPGKKNGVWEVPEGHYFMMGDNRDNSEDSRFWADLYDVTATVPEEQIVGKAFAIWMHWENKMSNLPSFGRAGGIE